MTMVVRFAVLALTLSDYASATDMNDPVRRTNQRDSSLDVHCVVWGDGPYFGMKFHSESEADERFKKAQREELVAIHYDKRFREVQRYQSHRMKGVQWTHLADWCKENNDVQAEAEVGVSASGTVESFAAHAPPASLLSDTTETVGVRASSSLVGTVTVLEKELAVLASKTSSLFKSIGESDPLSDLTLGRADGKLKTRVSELERSVSTMLGTTKTLEEELTGSAGSGPATDLLQRKGKLSIKAKVDALLPKVDNLKKRAAAIEGFHIVSDIGDLEGKVASFRMKAISLMQSLGLEGAAADAPAAKANSPIHVRVASLGTLIADVQRSTNHLGNEILERSFIDSTASVTSGPLKVKVESLAAKVEDLSGRFTALESDSLKNVVDKLEEKVASFHTKVIDVSKRISEEAHLEYKDTRGLATTKARVAALDTYMSEAQHKLEAMEEELLGGAKATHESLGETNSMKGKILALAVRVDSLLARVHHLEQEV